MKLSDLSAPTGALVDIIIRAKNGHELVENLLSSIAENTPRELYRVTLVDDGSEPPLVADVDTLVRSAKCQGAVTATNLGLCLVLPRTDADYVLVLDNDTEIPAGDVGWLGRMIAELEQGGPRTACVGAVTNFANPPQHALAAPITYTHDWSSEDGKRAGVRDNPAVATFISFAVLFRKSALRAVGLWDERYNPGNYEDTDYAMSLRAAGFELRVARSVYIHHIGHQTFRDDLQELLRVNGEKFFAKWGVGRLFDLGMVSGEQLKAAL